MRREAEDAGLWMGKTEEVCLKQTRRFIDRLTALTSLCVKAENRVLGFGKGDEVPKKDEKKEEEVDEFEFLNVSELCEQWDNEDKKVIDEDDVVCEQN